MNCLNYVCLNIFNLVMTNKYIVGSNVNNSRTVSPLDNEGNGSEVGKSGNEKGHNSSEASSAAHVKVDRFDESESDFDLKHMRLSGIVSKSKKKVVNESASDVGMKSELSESDFGSNVSSSEAGKEKLNRYGEKKTSRWSREKRVKVKTSECKYVGPVRKSQRIKDLKERKTDQVSEIVIFLFRLSCT